MLGGFAVPHSPASASVARQRLGALLDTQGVPADVVADLVLIVSELIGNAVSHARPLNSGLLQVEWELGPGVIKIAVTDGGAPTLPEALAPTLDAHGGRGLAIVDALASEWGVDRTAAASTVWATVRAGEPERVVQREQNEHNSGSWSSTG